ncbi:protein phosphatase 2C 70 [Nicotiana tabacum]|uniref:protein-serine/threonine phosphatase n=1 Tax=Nicotiana tabacum TaxID=4097 RepID=A0A1S3ZUI9_TOBAC|nr:PREDICTED: protein phosphatase 2C 70-like [Nicotiana tabacum]
MPGADDTMNMTTLSSSNIVLSKEGIFIVIFVMLLLILLFILIACKYKPWRFFYSTPVSSNSVFRHKNIIKADDVERPLISDDLHLIESQSHEYSRSYAHDAGGHQNQGAYGSPWTQGLVHKQRLTSINPQLMHSDSFVLDVCDTSEDISIGQTLKRPFVINQLAEEQKHIRSEDVKYRPNVAIQNEKFGDFAPKDTKDQRSILMLEVISGPCQGLQHSMQSTDTSRLPLTLGRVTPSDILLKDSEISGKHAMINWNINKLRWELVDMGSLNGTLVNSRAVHSPHSGSRQWGDPVELANGDIITLGTTSQIFVQIRSQSEHQVPFGIGVASDAMAVRRGGKKLPMEDVCYCHWPVPGTDKFGLFGICDGHGGAGAATSVSKIMPQIVASILSDSFRRERVLSQCDASDVLREAFSQTEASIDHHYEGCTATVLLVWADDHENFYVQCANVGDSACVVNIDGKLTKMTEDHRITSYSERMRIQATGDPLKDGETRLCGLNLARMLGDKFLKQQDARFSSEPYISQVLYIHQASKGFALLASDGFWDVINVKKAVQQVQQTKERSSTDEEISAEKIANSLLNEARTLRTKDNTSIIFLDFDTTNRILSCKIDS